MSQIMKSEGKRSVLQNEALRSCDSRSFSIAGKISLKEMFSTALALVRSAINQFEAFILGKQRCCQNTSNTTCSIEQQHAPTCRKRIPSEIYKGLKKAESISKVTHSGSDVFVAKPKGSICLKKISKDPKSSNAVQRRDSKNSISAQKKPHHSDSNGEKLLTSARKKNCLSRAQLRSSCNVGTKGFINPPHKLEQMSSLKAINVAKPKSHFSRTNLKAQLQHQNIDDKGLSFRLQREKDKLAKECKKGFINPPHKLEQSSLKIINVAKPKSRFSRTNLKAQLQHQNIDEKGRTFRMQGEKDKLAKECKREIPRIEAEVKAVKSTAQKAKFELKKKIRKEREASRLALEKMEVTVVFDDFNQAVKELKLLGCEDISFYVLRQLGLFLKDDDFDDHKIAQVPVRANEGLEEGKIGF